MLKVDRILSARLGDASGLNRESVLHVPDFAQSLLGAIHDSPVMRSGSRVSNDTDI